MAETDYIRLSPVGWNCPDKDLGIESYDDYDDELEVGNIDLWREIETEEESGGYNPPQESESAKNNTDTVSLLHELEKFRKEWACELMGNVQKWLTDGEGRVQFVIRDEFYTEVMWNDARQMKAQPFHKLRFLREDFVKWSPSGTYIVTVNKARAAVWGGASTFRFLKRYAHPKVEVVDFSPGDKYLVTYSKRELSSPPNCHRVLIKIFDVITGEVMIDFRVRTSADEFGFGETEDFSWPVIRWGGDLYFARVGKNGIHVYDTETFLSVGKCIAVENVKELSWCPAYPIFALFVPKQQNDGNQPARVSLYEIPSRKELVQKDLLGGVSDCKLYWQSEGEYLAVEVERSTTTETEFQVFRFKGDMRVEVFEVENKTIAFAWEPKGERFAIIHGHGGDKNDISFYSMKGKGGGKDVLKLTTLKQKQANALFWSPGGSYVILGGGLKRGVLEFYDMDVLQTMATAHHFVPIDIQWDPTGRYVATWMEDGVNIWSFNGKLLYRILKEDRILHFSWRPRPTSLVRPGKEEEIMKNLIKNISLQSREGGKG